MYFFIGIFVGYIYENKFIVIGGVFFFISNFVFIGMLIVYFNF